MNHNKNSDASLDPGYPFSPKQLPTLKKKRIRWWLILAIFGIPLVVLVGLTMAVRIGWTIREHQGRAVMNIELKKLASEGVPIDETALSEQYANRTSTAHTEDWELLFRQLESEDFAANSAGVPHIDRKVEIDDFAEILDTSPDWKFAEKCIQFTRDQNLLIAESRRLAIEQQPAYFPIHFQSAKTLLPEVQSLRKVAFLLLVDLQVAIFQRDNDRVFNDIIALIELSKHSDAVPALVAKMVGVGIRQLALQAIQEAVRVDVLTIEQWNSISQLLSKYTRIDQRWKDGLLDEMSTHLPSFYNLNLVIKSEKQLPARGHDAVYFIDLMRRASSIDTDNWQMFIRTAGEFEDEILSDTGYSLTTADRILSKLYAPSFTSFAYLLINDAQLHRQGRTAIALRLFHRLHQKWPNALAELPDYQQLQTAIADAQFGYQVETEHVILWGTWVSDANQKVPNSAPLTDESTSESLLNRKVVWILQ